MDTSMQINKISYSEGEISNEIIHEIVTAENYGLAERGDAAGRLGGLGNRRTVFMVWHTCIH